MHRVLGVQLVELLRGNWNMIVLTLVDESIDEFIA
jgi:hypothetical protein